MKAQRETVLRPGVWICLQHMHDPADDERANGWLIPSGTQTGVQRIGDIVLASLEQSS